MDNIEAICIEVAIVGIPLQPVNKNIFDVNSYPLRWITVTTRGNIINEATIISRLGHRTALMSRIGNGVAGYFIVDHCHQENVDTKSLKRGADIDISVNVGLVAADGERTFVTNRNGNSWRLNINDVGFDRFSQAKLLSLASIFNNPLLDGQTLTDTFTQAKVRRLIICADMVKPRLNEMLDDIREALSYMGYLFPNFREAKLLTGRDALGEIADSFLDCGVRTVVTETGKRGCFIERVDMEVAIPAVPGTITIDTIDAGDSFASGFISTLLESEPLRDCALFANATAAISVLSMGTTTGVKNRKLVE